MERSKQSAPGEALPSLLRSAGKPSLVGPYLDLAVVIERARRQRNQEIGRLIGRFFTWIETRMSRARQREIERVLSGATDLADLERRIRDLEQGKSALLG